MSVHYSLKKAFLQEFFKDISNKKGNFRQIEGKSVQLLKAYEGGTIGKENRRKSQAQRGKGRNFPAC